MAGRRASKAAEADQAIALDKQVHVAACSRRIARYAAKKRQGLDQVGRPQAIDMGCQQA